MNRNAPTIPPPGRCYCCGKTDVSNWIDDERNLCGDCCGTHIFCDSCGAEIALLEDWCREMPPGFEADTPVLCGHCLVKGLHF